MKEVYVLRHANWDGKEDALTEQGKINAEKCSTSLPDFAIVYSSPFVRTQQTAAILGKGIKPQIETAASVSQSPPEIRTQILERRSTHPLGIAGALFEAKEAHPALKIAGEALSQLIRQALDELQEGQKALIVSHDGTMVAAERMLTDDDFTRLLEYTYGELEGFTIDENLQLKRLDV
jgi:broad specificity phosphatase PhoE